MAATVALGGRRVLAGVLTFLLLACSQPPASPSPSPLVTPTQIAPPSDTARVITVPEGQLLFSGRLLICSDLPYPPQEFFDEQGNPVGSDIEIGQEIARRLGLEASVVNTLFDTIIDALDEDKCDIAISAQTITSEREALVDMIPYFQAGQAFIVQRGNPVNIRTELDLCGRRVGVQSGTVMEQAVLGEGDYEGNGLSERCTDAGNSAIELVKFDKDDDALHALIDGDTHAYATDSPVAGYHVVQNMNEIELSGVTLDVAAEGISVAKSKPGLRDAVRQALWAMMDESIYLTILSRYGVEDGSVAGQRTAE